MKFTIKDIHQLKEELNDKDFEMKCWRLATFVVLGFAFINLILK